jgi:hypothetical protein
VDWGSDAAASLSAAGFFSSTRRLVVLLDGEPEAESAELGLDPTIWSCS